MNQPPIQFIYFDLGNVIVHFDHSIGCRNVANLTGISREQARNYIFDSGLQHDYESGQINSTDFTRRFNALSGTNIDSRQLCLAISDVFSLNRQIIPLITQLAFVRFPIGILSNTCLAHWEFILAHFPIVERFFDSRNIVLSFESGSTKPNDKIYHDAIDCANEAADHIFFVDDRAENVAAACKCGIQSEIYAGVPTLIRRLVERNFFMNL